MVECPVCGAVSPQGQDACEVCGLPTKYFEALHAEVDSASNSNSALAVGPATTGPERVGPEATPPDPTDPSTTTTGGAAGNSSPPQDVETPQREPDRDPEDVEQPKDEALGIGSSLGMDVSGFERALERATLEGNRTQLSRVRRELVKSVLDGLMDRYRWLCERRDVLSSVMRTQTLDAILAAYRRALSKGELAVAEEQRGKAQRAIESFEASLGRIRTRLDEASQMMRALRELGGVAPNVLRPVAEAVKDPRRAEAGEIESRLTQTNVFLWGLLVPRMNHEISRCLSVLSQTKAPPSRTAPIRVEIDRMAEQIRAQNIGEALESHRFLRAELASLTPRAKPKPAQGFSIDQVHPS